MSYEIRKGDTPSIRQAKRSARRSLKRKLKKYDPKRSFTEISKHESPYDRDIEAFIKVNARKLDSKHGKYIELDNNFCLFENPNSVLFKLACLIKYSKSNSRQGELRYKNKISFGAMYLLDSFYHRIREKKRWNIATQNLQKEDLLFLNQLRSFKNQDEDSDTRHIVNARIRIDKAEFELKRREYDKCSTQIRSIVEQGIRESHNKDYKMPIREHNVISSAITEHFDNIFQHSKRAKFGNVCGFYNRVNPEVRIVIYNFGETIFETLSGSLPKDMKDQIDVVISNHTRKNFFVFGQNFTKENALTLLAIQEGISSKITGDSSRGHGLTDFIEHCFGLSENTKIRIISGQTAIKIDSRYKLKQGDFLGRNRRIIAFNEQNDIFEKPDSKYVENMSVKFPGVIIETQIPLTVN